MHHMAVYKIFLGQEWAALKASGETRGAPIDLADGYIHLSTAETVAETAAKYFAGVEGLVLVAVDPDDPAMKWEPSRDGALFPHLYRPLRMADVIWAKPLPCAVDGHIFPDGVL